MMYVVLINWVAAALIDGFGVRARLTTVLDAILGVATTYDFATTCRTYPVCHVDPLLS
jgi:hypothetical protein